MPLKAAWAHLGIRRSLQKTCLRRQQRGVIDLVASLALEVRPTVQRVQQQRLRGSIAHAKAALCLPASKVFDHDRQDYVGALQRGAPLRVGHLGAYQAELLEERPAGSAAELTSGLAPRAEEISSAGQTQEAHALPRDDTSRTSRVRIGEGEA